MQKISVACLDSICAKAHRWEPNMYKILIVEDDAIIAGEMNRHLGKWGYEVKNVEDFHQVLEQFTAFEPQLVLMDIGLPFYNGYYWCAEIRKFSKVPLIFISSASDNMNIVMAVNMGGDDFLAKPFELEVLSAKVQAMLRRTYAFQGQTLLLEYRHVILNLSEMAVFYESRKLELTKNEFRILKQLFEHSDTVSSRTDIMKQLWDEDCFVDDNTLTVNINRLRKKLADGGIPLQIQTKKGIGYLLGE